MSEINQLHPLYPKAERGMDINEIRIAQAELAAKISDAIKDFQDRTSVTVKSLDLQQFVTVASETPVRTHVSITLGI